MLPSQHLPKTTPSTQCQRAFGPLDDPETFRGNEGGSQWDAPGPFATLLSITRSKILSKHQKMATSNLTLRCINSKHWNCSKFSWMTSGISFAPQKIKTNVQYLYITSEFVPSNFQPFGPRIKTVAYHQDIGIHTPDTPTACNSETLSLSCWTWSKGRNKQNVMRLFETESVVKLVSRCTIAPVIACLLCGSYTQVSWCNQIGWTVS